MLPHGWDRAGEVALELLGARNSQKYGCVVATSEPTPILPGMKARSALLDFLHHLFAHIVHRRGVVERRAKGLSGGSIRDAPGAKMIFQKEVFFRVDRARIDVATQTIAAQAR